MGNILQFARDGLTNLVSRMGTERDKAASSSYVLTTLTDDQILAAYKTAWLPGTIPSTNHTSRSATRARRPISRRSSLTAANSGSGPRFSRN